MMQSVLKLDETPDSNAIAPIKALIVDDSSLDRLILQKMLTKKGYDVYTAFDGDMAVEMFEQCTPDIVFMDLYLPEKTGYEITESLKEISQGQYIPVIFVTAATDDASLEACLDSGGDDFIVKPIKESLLHAKIGSLLRIKKMHDDLLKEKKIIHEYATTQEKDMNDANEIIHNINVPLFYNPGNIKYSLEPQFIISGDIFCSAIGPTGNHVVLIGDNTGHGLPAAIGSLIVYDVFYTMVEKGFSLEIMIDEINQKLFRLLPSDRFLAATIIEVYSEDRVIKVFNAGMPDTIITNDDGSVVKRVSSMDMPLGIKQSCKNDIQTEMIAINNKNRIYIFSDGLPEIFNREGEQFTEDRIISAFQNPNADDWFDTILNDAEKFRDNSEKTDDLLFVEINCNDALVKTNERMKFFGEQQTTEQQAAMDWSFKLDLHGQAISHSNPVTASLDSISNIQGLKNHHEKLFLILSEMYSNSLEHSLLGLSSKIKEEEDGFMKYYQLRESGLETILDESLIIEINNRIETKKNILSISMSDTGSGFDYSNIESDLGSNKLKSGRGIALLADLCSRYEYSDGGKALKVEYEW